MRLEKRFDPNLRRVSTESQKLAFKVSNTQCADSNLGNTVKVKSLKLLICKMERTIDLGSDDLNELGIPE